MIRGTFCHKKVCQKEEIDYVLGKDAHDHLVSKFLFTKEQSTGKNLI